MKTPTIATIICILALLHTCAYSQLWKQYTDSAKVYKKQQKTDKALELYSKAREALQKDSMGTNSYATSCFNLAVFYREIGQFDKAEPLYLEAKHIREKTLGKTHPNYAAACNGLANLYWRMGQFNKAEQLYLEAIQINEKEVEKEHHDYALACNNLANLYRDMGLYEKAEPLYLKAKQMREREVGKEHPDYATSCNSLAILYREMGQFDKAEQLYLEAKQIREKAQGKEQPSYASSCNGLATLYWRMGQFDKAEPLFLEAKQIREKVLGKAHPEYATSCNGLATLYWKMKQYDKAEQLYLEAKQVQEKSLGKAHPNYAVSCGNLANLYREMGQYDQSEQLYLEAKQIREKVQGKEHPAYAACCNSLANLYVLMKKPEQAYTLYAEAYRSQQLQLKDIFSFTSEAEQQSYLKLTADLQHSFLSFCSLYPQYNHGLSYDMTIAGRNLILSSSQQLRNVIYTSRDTTAKKQYDNWINVREQLAYWYSKPLSERPAYVPHLEEQANSLEKELTRLSAAFLQQQTRNTTRWQDIQQALQPNEAAVEFSSFRFYNGKRWTDSTYYVALLLRKDQGEPELIPLFESRQLNRLLGAGGSTTQSIYALYASINKLYSSKEQQGVTTAYQLIWQPLEQYLRGIQKVYFAPAGLLFRVSFAALPTGEQQVLSDRYELVQLNTTAAVVSRSDNVIDNAHNIYLYGAIRYEVDAATLKQEAAAYDSSSSSENKESSFAAEPGRDGSLNFLTYTEKEVNEIASLSRQKDYPVAVVSGAAATEESIKALAGSASPSVLHIATHGFFFPPSRQSKPAGQQQQPGSGEVFRQSDNPLLRSGLLLAGAGSAWKGKGVAGRVEDGILTAYEVSNLYLPNTKLVVLSACETGLGDIEGNEGVYGLQRAFKMAGVKNLVMSLWKVSDKESSAFMQELYKNLFAGHSISEAFYHAQTMMRNKYPDEPYKWAPWILVQ